MPFLSIPFSLIFVCKRLIYIEKYQIYVFRFRKIYKSYMLYDPALLFVVRVPPAARSAPYTSNIDAITVIVARAVLEQMNASFFISCTRRKLVLETYIILMPLFTLSGVPRNDNADGPSSSSPDGWCSRGRQRRDGGPKKTTQRSRRQAKEDDAAS
jgi:hypothetical protein